MDDDRRRDEARETMQELLDGTARTARSGEDILLESAALVLARARVREMLVERGTPHRHEQEPGATFVGDACRHERTTFERSPCACGSKRERCDDCGTALGCERHATAERVGRAG